MSDALLIAFFCFVMVGTAVTLLTPSRTMIRARAVVVAMRLTGEACEERNEVELDVMVRRPRGGQFPARETAVVPARSLAMVTPGSIIETYYCPDDESAVAVLVPS